jgi:ribonuclease P protein component
MTALSSSDEAITIIYLILCDLLPTEPLMYHFSPVTCFDNGEIILACSPKVIHKGCQKSRLDKDGHRRCNLAFLLRGLSHETDLSAFGRSTQAYSRLPGTHAHSRRPCRHSCTPRQGPSSSQRLIAAVGIVAGDEISVRKAKDRTFRSFPSSARLHQPGEFAAVLASPLRARAGCFELRYCLNEASRSARLGLVVPKRLARQAVLRNGIKRIAREAFRHLLAELPSADIVIRLAAPARWPLRGSDGTQLIVWRTQIDGLLANISGRPAA